MKNEPMLPHTAPCCNHVQVLWLFHVEFSDVVCVCIVVVVVGGVSGARLQKKKKVNERKRKN